MNADPRIYMVTPTLRRHYVNDLDAMRTSTWLLRLEAARDRRPYEVITEVLRGPGV